MQKETAQTLIEISLEAGSAYDSVLGELGSQCSPEEFKTYQKAIGTVMGSMLTELMNPIFREFPDLKPGELE